MMDLWTEEAAAPADSALSVHDAQQLHREVVRLKAELSQNALAFGRALTAMKQSRAYAALGFARFGDYLDSDAVRVAPRTAQKFMRIAAKFADAPHEALSAVTDYNKLDLLGQLVRPGDGPEAVADVLEWGRAIPREELPRAIRSLQHVLAQHQEDAPRDSLDLRVVYKSPAQPSPAPEPDAPTWQQPDNGDHEAGAIVTVPIDPEDRWPSLVPAPPAETTEFIPPPRRPTLLNDLEALLDVVGGAYLGRVRWAPLVQTDPAEIVRLLVEEDSQRGQEDMLTFGESLNEGDHRGVLPTIAWLLRLFDAYNRHVAAEPSLGLAAITVALPPQED